MTKPAMTKVALLAAALLASSALPLMAQPAPFDMTPESGLRVTPPPAASAITTQPAVPPVIVAPQQTERFVLPSPAIRLVGEESRQAMVVYLTQAQAEAPARLQLSYLNAIVVASEISQLRIGVNGTQVAVTPIASSTGATPIVAELPAGLLHAGANTITFAASQRHRTDCSVNSTFELWTEIAGSSAALNFAGGDLAQLSQLADLAAVGVDAAGRTTIRLVTTDLGRPEVTSAAITLVQQLALALRVADLDIELASDLSDAAAPGVLDVVLAPFDQLPAGLTGLGTQAGPLAAMVPQSSRANTLVVSGANWADVAHASDAILAAAPVSPARPRVDLPQPVPTMLGGQTETLAALGVPTVEFNGRRYSARFQFELPSDFYANQYGEAELVIDAAYSSDVEPGSEIDVFTNTEIASATPLLRTDGGLLRDTVIRVPMTNLRPGRNEVDVVVNLRTQSDTVCSPGWTGVAPVRFVLSSSSQFRMPDYARIAALPNLEVMTGSAWPYSQDQQVSLVLGGGNDVAAAAMTLLARAAAASGKVLPVTIVAESALRPEQNAIVVMSVSEMSPPTIGRSGLSRAASASQAADESAVLDQFRADGNQGNAFVGAADWVLQHVGLSLADLWLVPRRETLYGVGNGEVVMAQSVQPEGGVWTILTSTDNTSMLTGIQRLAVTEQWRQISGRVSALGPASNTVKVIQTLTPKLLPTQPVSLWNLRLVAANWFSSNILAFTAALAAAAVLLMLATALLLTKSGREK